MNIFSICNSPDIMKVIRIIVLLINIIKIVVPIILIVFLMIKIMGAVSKHNQEEIVKTIRSSIPNIIAAVLIFLVPTFVDMVARLSMPNSDYAKCISEISKEKIEEAYISKMDELVDLAEKNRTMSSYSVAKTYLSNIKDSKLKQEYEERLNKVYVSISGGDNDDEPTKFSEKLEILSVEVVDTVVNVKVTNSPNKVSGYYFSSIQKTPDLNGFDWIESNKTSFRTVKYPGKYYLYAKDSAGYITPPKEVIVPEVFDVTLMHKGKKLFPVSFATYLPKHGSSVEEFNSKIASYNKKFGLRTRESVVLGAMAFTGEIQGMGYYLPYSGSNEAISKERWGIHKYWGGPGKTFIACDPFVVWCYKNAGLNIYANRSKMRRYTKLTQVNNNGTTQEYKPYKTPLYKNEIRIYYFFVGVVGSTSEIGDNIVAQQKGLPGDVLQNGWMSGHEMLIVDKYDDDMDGVSDGYIVLQSRNIGLCYEKRPYSAGVIVYDMSKVFDNTAGFRDVLLGWEDYFIPESDYPSYLK